MMDIGRAREEIDCRYGVIGEVEVGCCCLVYNGVDFYLSAERARVGES
jgi:hypothetical protein